MEDLPHVACPHPRDVRYRFAQQKKAAPVAEIRFSGALKTRAEEIAREFSDLPGVPGGGMGGGPDGGSLQVHVEERRDDALRRDEITGLFHEEGYEIRFEEPGSRETLEQVRIAVGGSRGLRYALSTLSGIIRRGVPRAGLTVRDAPRFGIRGLIEGYYGPPWSQAARRDLIRLMARYKMNSYFYGPKDDAFHRRRWREPYDEAARAGLAELKELCDALDMTFWYTIGPGLTMSYADESDFEALAEKLSQVGEIGVTAFGLLFDDIPERLQHEADREAFQSLPEAHAAVANRLFSRLTERAPISRLVVCPTQYHGAGTERYIAELGSLLDPRIEVFWTGPEICSRELTLRDAATVERTISRPALYWDNYPVNDCEMVNELHIGPYRGRDPHLYRAGIGVVANGMEHPESTKIGLITIADYLWSPEDYDPERSWDDALEAVVGSEEWRAFKVFADNNRYSALNRGESPELSRRLEAVSFLRATGQYAEARRELDDAISELTRAVELFDRGLTNGELESEIAPWIEKYRKGVRLLEAAAELAEAPTAARKRKLEERLGAYRKDPRYTFSDLLDEPLADIVGELPQ